jgi:hypothetical protein
VDTTSDPPSPVRRRRHPPPHIAVRPTGASFARARNDLYDNSFLNDVAFVTYRFYAEMQRLALLPISRASNSWASWRAPRGAPLADEMAFPSIDRPRFPLEDAPISLSATISFLSQCGLDHDHALSTAVLVASSIWSGNFGDARPSWHT